MLPSTCLSGMSKTFDITHITNIATSYDRKSVMALFKDMPNFTMCLGPGCDSGQIHGGGYENPIMTCTSCGFRSCTVHHLPWHTGMTCAEFDAQPSDAERAEQEAASQKLLFETAQLCSGCKRHIQKTSGCDHMTCKWWLPWALKNSD